MSDPNPELDDWMAHGFRVSASNAIGCATVVDLCILLGSVVIIAAVVDWATGGRLLGD